MSGSRFVVIGDVVNDIVAAPRGEIRPNTDTPSSIRPRPGGSAANTAAWLASVGAEVDFVGAIGSHDEGEHRQVFEEAGVTAHLQVEYGMATGSIVIVVEPERRSMLTERGANALLDTAAVTDTMLAEASLLHISAYSILDGFGAEGAQDLIRRATAAGVAVSVNPGSIGYLRDFGVDRFLAAIEGTSIIFPNAREARAMTGLDDPHAALRALLARFDTVVLTLGAAGAIAGSRGGEIVSAAAPKVRLVDPTGAGDAFAAGFLERWVPTRDLSASLSAAVLVAARAVMCVGGRPPL